MRTRLRLLRQADSADGEIDWESAYQAYLPRIFNYFCYRTCDETLAEDLAAATFEKAWRSRNRYRSDLAAFSTWLFTIARNLATDHFRRRQELPLEEAASLQTPGSLEDSIESQADLKRLAQLLHNLSERERELIALKYGAELTNRAIARQTGLSENNIAAVLHRAVVRLRAKWEPEV
jgi:RNA polymerase sigma-70 factor (ECF subfamily)